MFTSQKSYAAAILLLTLLGGAQFSMKTMQISPATAFAAEATPLLDSITFGDAASELRHNLVATNSDTITGALGQPARRFLPRPTPDQKPDWQGGSATLTIKVDPQQPNYFTIKLWGDDVTVNRLYLYIEGKQVGYRHLGDVDSLDFGAEHAAYKGRFYYNTSPLPVALTQGKTQLNCEIRSTGRIWGYGMTFDLYQRAMTEPTRGIYSVYTHTDGFFEPPAHEKQGTPPAPQLRVEPGPEVMEQLKQRVNNEVKKYIAAPRPLNQMQTHFLARATQVKWTAAYQNPQAVQQVVKSFDALYSAYQANPKLAEAEPSTYNPDWFGFGPMGQAVSLLAEPLKPFLDQKIEGAEANENITRRAGWTKMLVASRDWHRRNRRLYTNQSMINDTYGIYLSNRGVSALAPDKAMPEPEARRYLYESLGLQPWLGSETDKGPSKSAGENYLQLTAKGLTKELGYVGYYGEVLDWAVKIYDATRPTPGQPGDPQIKEQIVKIARARAAFRYPSLDDEGNRAMVVESIVGWRDAHYGSDVVYAQRTSWDGSPLEIIAATLDPQLIGYAQQMFEDNQYFASVKQRMENNGFRVTAGLLDTPDEYEIIKAQPPSRTRLPMSPAQPDFVFSDEEDGVVALKNGSDILYVSLYWRARFGINNLARVHYVTPNFDRIAVVRQDTQFEPSGMTFTRANQTNTDFAPWLPKYPDEQNSAHAGEVLPIAKIPTGIDFKPGKESVYAGKGDFYTLRYGPYLIAMNLTTDKTFDLAVPRNAAPIRELVSKSSAPGGSVKRVGPRSTVVFYMGAL